MSYLPSFAKNLPPVPRDPAQAALRHLADNPPPDRAAWITALRAASYELEQLALQVGSEIARSREP